MTWIPSRKDFDNYQEKILEDIVTDSKESWWLQGYPGTGKTMLLIHLIAEYIDAGWDCAFVNLHPIFCYRQSFASKSQMAKIKLIT